MRPKPIPGASNSDIVRARQVAALLGMDRTDIARAAGIKASAVRFGTAMPQEMQTLFLELNSMFVHVDQYFQGHRAKTALWFRLSNPLLGDISPLDMIRCGRFAKLRQFVMDALAENSAVPVTGEPRG